MILGDWLAGWLIGWITDWPAGGMAGQLTVYFAQYCMEAVNAIVKWHKERERQEERLKCPFYHHTVERGESERKGTGRWGTEGER